MLATSKLVRDHLGWLLAATGGQAISTRSKRAVVRLSSASRKRRAQFTFWDVSARSPELFRINLRASLKRMSVVPEAMFRERLTSILPFGPASLPAHGVRHAWPACGILGQGTSDIDPAVGETTLVIPSDVSLVAGTRLYQPRFARNRHDGQGRSER